MRHLLIGIALIITVFMATNYAMAGRILLTLIGPSTSAARVTIAAAGASTRNCLTDVDVSSDAAYIFRILDGGTTAYAVTLSSGGALVRSWGQDMPFCGAANTLMEITVTAGNYNINYSGFTGQ